jgi:hypothetical protein
MKLAMFSLIYVFLLADETANKGKSPLENIEIIVGIVVGIATVIIAYLTYRWSKKEKGEKITAGKNVATGKSKIKNEEAGRDILKAGRDIIIQQPAEKEKEGKKKLDFPFAPALNNQTPPEENFVGREEELETITDWYKSKDVRIGALIGWGGVGKSALVRTGDNGAQKSKKVHR